MTNFCSTAASTPRWPDAAYPTCVGELFHFVKDYGQKAQNSQEHIPSYSFTTFNRELLVLLHGATTFNIVVRRWQLLKSRPFSSGQVL